MTAAKWSNRPRIVHTAWLPSGSSVRGVIRAWLGDQRVELETAGGSRIVASLRRPGAAS